MLKKRTALERLLAAFLCVVLLVGLLPMSIFQATAEDNIGDGVDVTYVAAVGEDQYATLAEAVAVGGEVTLLADVALTEALVVERDVTITGNYTISSNVTDAIVVKAGTLTLGAGVKVVGTSAVLYGNGGNIVINGATVKLNNANCQYSAVYFDGGKLTVNSGSISANNASTTVIMDNGTTMNINGGTLSSALGSVVVAKNGAKVTMTAGAVSTDAVDAEGREYTALYSISGGSITISGGTINAPVRPADESSSVSVSGGTFTTDVTEYCVDGVVVIDNGDGTYTVRKKQDQNAQISEAATIQVDEETTVSVTGAAEGAAVSFSTENADIIELTDNGDGTATVKGVGAGTATVTAKVSETDLYNAAELSVEITVEPLEAPEGNGFAVESDTIVLNQTKQYAVTIPQEYKRVTVESGNETVATAQYENGIVKVTGVSVGTAEITLKLRSMRYAPVDYKLQITVKAEQDELVLDCPAAITYNEYENNQLTVSVTGGSANGAVTYKSSDPAVISADGNVLTVHKSGTATITATMAGNESYVEVSDSVTVTVSKADQDLGINAGDEIYNSEDSYTIPFNSATGNYAADRFVYAHYKTGLENSTFENGVLTIGEGDSGIITVEVYNEGNECYNRWPSNGVYRFNLTVKEIEISGPVFTLTGTEGDNGWYTSNVVVSGVNDKGEVLVFSEKKNQTAETTYTLSTEGETDLSLWAKPKWMKDQGKNGKTKMHIGIIKIDKTVPTIEMGDPEYAGDFGDILGEIFTLGVYSSPVNLPLTAADSVSGVAAIHYSTDGGKTWTEVKGDKATITVSQSYDANQIVYYSVDNAGLASNQVVHDEEIIFDTVDPTAAITLSEAKQVVGTKHYYNAAATVTVTVTEANFDGKHITIKDNDSTYKNVSWTDGENDTHTATVTVSAEGEHVVTVEGTDKSGRPLAKVSSETIVIDTQAPVSSISYGNDVWGAVLESLTFGYYKSEATVTIQATDKTSFVDVIWYNYNGTDISAEPDKDGKITFSIPADYNGQVTYWAVDAATNEEAHKTGKVTLIVDDDAPELVSVVWSEAKQTKDSVHYYDGNAVATVTIKEVNFFEGKAAEDGRGAGVLVYDNGNEIKFDGAWAAATDENGAVIADTWVNTVTLTDDDDHNLQVTYTDRSKNEMSSYGSDKIVIDATAPVLSVSYAEEPKPNEVDGHRYYQGTASITLTVEEHNFNEDDVNFVITAVNAAGTDISASAAPTYSAWTHDGDKHSVTLTFASDANYTLDATYSDLALRPSNDLETQVFTVDTVDPTVSVSYDPDVAVKLTVDDRDYYQATQTATVTVIEQNFSEDGVEFIITGKNSDGAEQTVSPTYSAWTHSGEKHTATVTFSADSNYTLDVKCTDLALREGKLGEELFTVDTNAPTDLNISFSAHNEEGGVFYFGSAATVYLSAKDATAGVDAFDYTYTVGSGVSSVNNGGSGTVNTSHEDGAYKAEFKIEPQFNGTVSFTAADRSTNSTTENGTQTIVVDSIAPTAVVTYNAPYKTQGGASYYAGDINATIVITEANFFSEDVSVLVTRDGKSYPVKIRWTNNSTDKHTGTFTLAEDGDYVVNVTYTDRSGNAMKAYTSEQLTRDTVQPTVQVSNVEHNSANTAKPYSFTITADDINIDTSTFKPVLTAVVLAADGTFTEKTIDLGSQVAVKNGQTYAYEIADLAEDAIYTLTCTVKDLAGNTYSQMVLDDGKAYSEVQFSINRDGSTFLLGEYTKEVVGNYYNKDITEDIVVIEINADELSEHAVTLNGKTLAEGSDYTVTAEGGNGSWMQYTYSVNKDLFADEGEYQLVISSTDKAGNAAFSDVKNAVVRFVVDRTAPVITVTGMANNGRYQTESQTVTLIPTDAGGALSYIKVVLVDDNGKILDTLLELSGEDLAEALEAGEGALNFQIGEGLYQNVQVICHDSAIGEENFNTYDETFTNLSVSTNGFMIFWANKPVRNILIIVLVLLIAFLIFLFARKKKKEQ